MPETLARTELACIQTAFQSVQGKKSEAWKLLGYNDRFALTRRVKRLLSQFPHLQAEFAPVTAAFLDRRRSTRPGPDDRT